jgi:hypothetical protein
MEEEKIQLLYLETGLLWPHYKQKKALSANTLTKILKEIEYEEIPEYILLQAAQRGKTFHKTIQEFVQTGNYPAFVDLAKEAISSNVERRIHETINFLKNPSPELPRLNNFLGKERLHYVFYKGDLLATYLDLEFQDYIIELKTNSVKINESPLALLVFEIQLLIQYLCTGKSVYLLWSTGKGIVFNNFQPSEYSLKILDILIDLVKSGETYSLSVKKVIVQEMMIKYLPKKLM